MPPEWKDSLGRPIKYLRVSVTDRCNLRCRYCMPAEGIKLQDKSRLMSYEEITEFARIAAARGIRSIRLTGGEDRKSTRLNSSHAPPTAPCWLIRPASCARPA